jgi:uncharacterized membrane protein
MSFLYTLIKQPILMALVLLLLVLLFIFFSLYFYRRKKNAKNKLEVPKTGSPKTEVEITDEFKKLVGDVDLNLKDSNLDLQALEDMEETLLALKELYEKEYISEEEYTTRTVSVMKSLNKTNAS